jgi:hypothetical protein
VPKCSNSLSYELWFGIFSTHVCLVLLNKQDETAHILNGDISPDILLFATDLETEI